MARAGAICARLVLMAARLLFILEKAVKARQVPEKPPVGTTLIG